MTYTFIAVGDRLYRMDSLTGNTWYESYGQWYLVKEPVATA